MNMDDFRLTERIVDETTARAWLLNAAKTMGAGFHPDTAGSDYIRYNDPNGPDGVDKSGDRVFTDIEAVAFDACMAEVFKYVDPYLVCLDAGWPNNMGANP